MIHKPFIFILSSPSGAGKTTIAKALLQSDNNIEMSISYTTRTKRENEISGKDYFFVDEEEFDNLIKQNKFIEHVKVFEKSYGTPKDQVSNLLSKGKDVLFDIDWQGVKHLQKIVPQQNMVSVFILPPSMKELETRLKNRRSETDEIINRRLSQAKIDINQSNCYDYIVVNDTIDETLAIIKSILCVERIKRAEISEKLANLTNEQI